MINWFCSYHSFPPLHAWGWEQQNAALEGMQILKPGKDDCLILGGDFNSTTYVANLPNMLARLNLKDSRQGFGLEPSWSSQEPIRLPFSGNRFELSNSLPGDFVLLPIDYIFVSKPLVVVNRQVGAFYGSDHYPVSIDVLVPQ